MKRNASLEGNLNNFMPGKSRFDFLQWAREHLLPVFIAKSQKLIGEL